MLRLRGKGSRSQVYTTSTLRERGTSISMSPKHRTNRNDLFLVRFWLDDTSGESEGQSGWGGRVQRAVSGESREFNNWEALVNALRAMLATSSPQFLLGGRPEKNGSSAPESSKTGERQ